MQQWLNLLMDQIQQTTPWEWIAVLFSVTEVLLARKNKVWLYPAGIASSAITICLLFKAGLYADSALNAYYVLMSVYGWILWVRRKGHAPLQVAYANRSEWIITLLIAFAGWGILYVLLKYYTPSTVPVWDAWISSSAWAGTWLLARRRIENWLVLNVSNLFAIPLLFHKHLPLFALLTIFLFIVAIVAFFDWQKIYRKQSLKPQVQNMQTIHHPAALLQPEWVVTIRKNAFAAEQAGLLQPEQLELIYEQQWFKLLVPEIYGGLEIPLPDLVRLEEALSWADGSLGWVVTLCAGAGWFGGFLPPETANAIFADPHVCLAGSGADSGTATLTANGYMLNGSWKYASGVRHATHFTANCVIMQGEEPVLDANGAPLILPFVIDKDDATLIPAWKYIGMMGTGSHAFSLNNITVAANRSFKIDWQAAIIKSPLYTYPFLQLAETTLAANLAGMALHFIDLCNEVFLQKAKQPRLTDGQRLVMLNTLQDIKNNVQAMRDSFYYALDASWQALTADEYIPENMLKSVSRTSRLLAQISRESVDVLYPYCGLLAASPDTELNQVWRDLHTASQHALLTFAE